MIPAPGDGGPAPAPSATPVPPGPDPARTYRRSAGTRVVAVTCVALLVAAAASVIATSGITDGFLVLAGLALLSVVNLAGAMADRITLDAHGIEQDNAWLRRLGLRRPRRVAWDDIVRLREHHRRRAVPAGGGSSGASPAALFLTLRSGRRMVIDSLERYDEAVVTIRRHCGHGAAAGGSAGKEGGTPA